MEVGGMAKSGARSFRAEVWRGDWKAGEAGEAEREGRGEEEDGFEDAVSSVDCWSLSSEKEGAEEREVDSSVEDVSTLKRLALGRPRSSGLRLGSGRGGTERGFRKGKGRGGTCEKGLKNEFCCCGG